MRCNYKALSAISLRTIPSLLVTWVALPIRVLWCTNTDFWPLLEMISNHSGRKQVWESSPCATICKTEGIRGMFAVEGLCQSSPKRVARGSQRKHEKSHLSEANGVKTQVNNRNFKTTALMPCKDFWVINITYPSPFLSRSFGISTPINFFFLYLFLSGKIAEIMTILMGQCVPEWSVHSNRFLAICKIVTEKEVVLVAETHCSSVTYDHTLPPSLY